MVVNPIGFGEKLKPDHDPFSVPSSVYNYPLDIVFWLIQITAYHIEYLVSCPTTIEHFEYSLA
jgi:hypothetical protein